MRAPNLLKYITLIYALFLITGASYFRFLLNWIEANSALSVSNIIWLGFFILGLAVAVVVGINFYKIGIKRVVLAGVIFLAGLGYAATFSVPAERTHLLKYGVLGALGFFQAFLAKHSKWRAIFFALGFAFFVACIDELFQYFLPSRVGDPRDLLFGVLGAAWAVGVCSVLVVKRNY